MHEILDRYALFAKKLSDSDQGVACDRTETSALADRIKKCIFMAEVGLKITV